ncbi:MAG TPA: DUF1622 domain-containing protein [Falsiroseomonas sp.]|jgi:uncharacterized membrane protein|nr:DUF1622 domain-containing protein [Falsiroseomonas sp.]
MGNSDEDLIGVVAHWVMFGLELAGLAAILLGVTVTTLRYMRDIAAGNAEEGYDCYRKRLGRAILIGLELLVAADIVGTVAAPLDLQRVLALALVVLIRTFLSLSIEVEISGRWPWRQHEAAQKDRQAG